MNRSAAETPGYIPTLDGWRAISILLVLAAHSATSHPFLKTLTGYGNCGVSIFFAISGLLICGRLLAEEKRSGHISLRRFYIRRAFRILPPALAYLLVVAALSPILGTDRKEWLAALFFVRNYVGGGLPPLHWFTAHFWSLSVEEHFYLLLPGILLLFPRYRAWVLGGLVAAVTLWRFWLAHHFHVYYVEQRTDGILDALLIPALFAIVVSRDRYALLLRRLLKPWVTLLIVVAYLCALTLNVPLNYSLRTTLLSLLLLSTSLNPGSAFGRLLESNALRWLGRLSYSLYIWQQLFFCDRWWHGALPLGIWQQWPLKIVGLLAIASLSYYALERPMLRMGHRVASSGVPARETDEPQGMHPGVPLGGAVGVD